MDTAVVNKNVPEGKSELLSQSSGTSSTGQTLELAKCDSNEMDRFAATLEAGSFQKLRNGAFGEPLKVVLPEVARESGRSPLHSSRADGKDTANQEQVMTQQPDAGSATPIERIMDVLNSLQAMLESKPRALNAYYTILKDLGVLVAEAIWEIDSIEPVELIRIADLNSRSPSRAFLNVLSDLNIGNGPRANATEEIWKIVQGKVKPESVSKALQRSVDVSPGEKKVDPAWSGNIAMNSPMKDPEILHTQIEWITIRGIQHRAAVARVEPKCRHCDREGHDEDHCQRVHPEPWKKVVCTHCKKEGHDKANCFHLHPERMIKLVCAYCGKLGHKENRCWSQYPELRPYNHQKEDGNTANVEYNKHGVDSEGFPVKQTSSPRSFTQADVGGGIALNTSQQRQEISWDMDAVERSEGEATSISFW